VTVEALGWASSFVLVLTLGRQVWGQWQKGSSKGVSRWLFIGQLCASSGFLVYSWKLGSEVFVVTNALLMLSAILGLVIISMHRRRGRDGRRENVPGRSATMWRDDTGADRPASAPRGIAASAPGMERAP
jgi:MtN3 and saliva related transmembrane protein